MKTYRLKESLERINEDLSDKSKLIIPGGFHSWPRSSSLLEALAAMQSPQVERWQRLHQNKITNKPWTVRCQGLTNDERHCFISSNNSDFRGIYKFTNDIFVKRNIKPIRKATFPSRLGNHIGDIDHYQGTIYVPIETPGYVARVLLEYDTDLNLKRTLELRPNEADHMPQSHFSWCAINPWNKYLYSSEFDGGVQHVNAFDPRNNYTFVKRLKLQGPAINRVQGGCFSKNGHLYLTTDTEKDNLRAYSVLNGAFLGARTIEVDQSSPKFEEVEGVAIWPISIDNQSVQVHVILLDKDSIIGGNIVFNKDDIFLKSFAVPVPENL